MSKISCLIRVGEIPLHLYQITSGFLMLKNNGIINLRIEKLKKNDKDSLPYNMMEVIINDHIRMIYDVNDGYDNLLTRNMDYVELFNRLLVNTDFYFKRSFSQKYNRKIIGNHKMYPLGLNYMVTVPRNIAHYSTPNDPNKEKLKKLIRRVPFTQHFNGLFYTDSFEDIPLRDDNPSILFMARLWDINGEGGMDLPSVKKEERAFINEQRVKCIRLCRKEFGDSFFGGINPTKYSLENYPDVVILDKDVTKRNNYIRRVKQSSICIATMGLHESIGWKFAEYIAASKAIVTEELHYELPGDINNHQNYLVFKTPEQCVEHVYKLKTSEDLRYQMMHNNFNYYHQHVRPDRLVLNSLLTVLKNGGIKHEASINSFYSNV